MKILNLLTFGLILSDFSCDALQIPIKLSKSSFVSSSNHKHQQRSLLTRLDLDVSHFIVPSSFQVQASSQSSDSVNKSPFSSVSKLAQSISNNSFWSKYSISLNFKPIRTKALSSMLGFAFGELVFQLIFNKVINSLLNIYVFIILVINEY